MRKVFAGLAMLLMLAVVAQFFLAANGAFNTAPNDESFQPHRVLGLGIVLLAVVMTLVAALARMPGRLIGLTGLVAGLGIVQSLIRAIADAFGDKGDTTTTTGQLIFGLHGINALVIMAAVATIVRQARALSRSAAPTRHARPGDDAIASGQAAEPAS